MGGLNEKKKNLYYLSKVQDEAKEEEGHFMNMSPFQLC